MDEGKKTVEPVKDPERPRNWDTSGCPFFIFGDDEAAEYDLNKLKKFFNKFKKHKK